MKVLSTKRYNELLSKEYHYGLLESELAQAKDLKKIIERITNKSDFFATATAGVYSISGQFDPLSSGHAITLNVKGNIATIVNDELSNELILQQTATRVVFLNEKGDVEKSGFTKQKADAGYAYKLVRAPKPNASASLRAPKSK